MLDKIQTSHENFIKTQNQSFFPGRQKFLQENIKGMMGSTWDASHLTSFLNKSFYSNKIRSQKDRDSVYEQKQYSIRRKKPGDFFFKNLRYDQNKSHIGYTNINPLISNIDISTEKQKFLVDYFVKKTQKLSQEKINQQLPLKYASTHKFRFQGNQVKFRTTDPLTGKNQIEKPQKYGFQIERMKKQIASRYPHGMIGLDHPQSEKTSFYSYSLEKQKQKRIDSKNQTSFQLNREWNRKKRIPLITEIQKLRNSEYLRKFRNENIHGYNIVTNRRIVENQNKKHFNI